MIIMGDGYDHNGALDDVVGTEADQCVAVTHLSGNVCVVSPVSIHVVGVGVAALWNAIQCLK